MTLAALMEFGPYLAAIAAFIGVYFFGRKHAADKAAGEVQSAKDDAKAVQAVASERVAVAEKTVSALETKENVKANIESKPVGHAANELRDKWRRD